MMMKYFILVALALSVLAAGLWVVAADAPSQNERRQQADKLSREGNWKDAYEIYRKLALDPADEATAVAHDLTHAVQALRQLGRVDEVDAFREKVIEAHKDNWRLLWTSARSFQ